MYSISIESAITYSYKEASFTACVRIRIKLSKMRSRVIKNDIKGESNITTECSFFHETFLLSMQISSATGLMPILRFCSRKIFTDLSSIVSIITIGHEAK